MYGDRPVIMEAGPVPDALIDLLHAEGLARMLEHEHHNLVLDGRKQYPPLPLVQDGFLDGQPQLPRCHIRLHGGPLRIARLPSAQVGVQAGQQNRLVEGLDQIVVPTHVQRPDDGGAVVLGADEEDGSVRPLPQHPAQGDAVRIRQHDIQQKRLEALNLLHTDLRHVRRRRDAEPMLHQIVADHGGNFVVILHKQYPFLFHSLLLTLNPRPRIRYHGDKFLRIMEFSCIKKFGSSPAWL